MDSPHVARDRRQRRDACWAVSFLVVATSAIALGIAGSMTPPSGSDVRVDWRALRGGDVHGGRRRGVGGSFGRQPRTHRRERAQDDGEVGTRRGERVRAQELDDVGTELWVHDVGGVGTGGD